MTMHLWAVVLFWSLAGLALYNTFWALVTAWILRRRSAPLSSNAELPRVAVLLCLRGADPNLDLCLRRLLAQDYPDYEIFIAVDSKSDPAWAVVQQAIRSSGFEHVHVSPLRNRLSTCSLKCSSLVQLLDEVDESHEVIVLADSDLESHRSWLRQLVAPMSDGRVGATFGNRWFMPEAGWTGSLVRQLCNAPSIVVMFAAQIPWGGSLAIRSSVVREGRLKEKWSRAIVDDAPVRSAVRQQKLRLQFVPSLLMANREDCDLRFAYTFLRRQLTWTSTYIRSWWPLLLSYSLASVGLWLTAVALAIVCLAKGMTAEAWLLAGGAGILGGVAPALWFVLDASARRVIRRQGERAERARFRPLRFAVAAVLSTAFHLAAAVAATFGRRITWRGVRYEIAGPWDIRVLEDQGFATSASKAPGASI